MKEDKGNKTENFQEKRTNWLTIATIILASASTGALIIKLTLFSIGFGGVSSENLDKDNKVTFEHLSEDIKEVSAPLYENIASISGPTSIQISKSVSNAPESTAPKEEKPLITESSSTLPSTLDIYDQEGGTKVPPLGQEPQQPLEKNPVELETPILEATPPPTRAENSVETADPRDIPITANDGPDKAYEETSLNVQRTLTALLPQGEKQLIRMRIPVMYKSRTLRLDKDGQLRAKKVLEELKKKEKELGDLKVQIENLLKEWNQLVEKSTPYSVLLPESPSLPSNQSTGEINRTNNPFLAPGKAINYEVLNQ